MTRLLACWVAVLAAVALAWQLPHPRHGAAQTPTPPAWDLSFSDRTPSLRNAFSLLVCAGPIQPLIVNGAGAPVCPSGAVLLPGESAADALTLLNFDTLTQDTAGNITGGNAAGRPNNVVGTVSGSTVHLVVTFPQTPGLYNSTHTWTLDGTVTPVPNDGAHHTLLAAGSPLSSGLGYMGVPNAVQLGQATGTITTETGASINWSWDGGLSGFLPTRIQLNFTAPPQTGSAGVLAPVQVTLTRLGGQVQTAFSDRITLSLKDNPGGATLGGTTTRRLVNGVATFADLTLDKPGQGYTLTASDPDFPVPNAISTGFDITRGWQLAFLTQPPQPPQQGTVGLALPPVQVQVQQADGSPLVGATALVHLAIQNNPGGATLGGAQAAAGVQPDASTGIAKFSDLTLDKVGQGYTLLATDEDPSVVTAVSASFNVAGLKLVFTSEPPSQGIPLGDPTFGALGNVRVTVEDANAQPVTGATALVHVALQVPPKPLTCVTDAVACAIIFIGYLGNTLPNLVGTSAQLPVHGVATFADLAIHDGCGACTLLATDDDPAVASATSTPFTVTPFQLGFAQQPPTAVGAGQRLPPVQVGIFIDNQRVNQIVYPQEATAPVTLALAPTTTGAVLRGGAPVNAVDGTATFEGLSISKPGQYQLVATSPIAATASSRIITVGASLTVTDTVTGGAYPPAGTTVSGYVPIGGSTTLFGNAAPAPVQVGDGLQVGGGGWDPTGGPVQLNWDGEGGPTDIPATVAVQPDGTFSTTLAAPSEHRMAWTLSTPGGNSPQPACTANLTATQGSNRMDLLLTGSATFYVADMSLTGDPAAVGGASAFIHAAAIGAQVVFVDGDVRAGLSANGGGPLQVVQVQSGVQYLCAGEVDGPYGPTVDPGAYLSTYAVVPSNRDLGTNSFTATVETKQDGTKVYKNENLAIANWSPGGQLIDKAAGIRISGLPVYPGTYTCTPPASEFVTLGAIGVDANGNGVLGPVGPVEPGCIANPGPSPAKLPLAPGPNEKPQILSGTLAATTINGLAYAAGNLTITGKLTLANGNLKVEGDLKVSGGVQGSGSIQANGKIEIAGPIDLSTSDVFGITAVGGAYLYGTSAVGSQTTLTASLQPGTSEVPVASSAAFFVGDLVAINQGQANEEDRTVTGFGSLKLNKPLLLPHTPGEPVVPLLTAMPDTTPPHATATASAQPNAAGWFTAPLTVTLAAQDNPGGAGVLATYYALDTPACAPTHLSACTRYSGTPVGLSSDGRHTLSYFSADRAGNLEAVHTLSINLDQTPPATTATPAGSGCVQQVTLTASDTTSGVAGIEYQLGKGNWQVYTSPLQLLVGQQLQYQAHDVAGNVETAHRFSFPPPTGKRCPAPFG